MFVLAKACCFGVCYAVLSDLGSVVWYLSCTTAEFGYLRLGCVLLRVF